MFSHDISYTIMRERVAELRERAAADRRASRIAKSNRAKKVRRAR